MKDTAIIYSWRENGKDYQKEVNRKDFYAMFDGLAKGFDKMSDNEISKKLIKIIPDVDEIFVNKDYNETQEIPSIVCHKNGDVQLMKIRRRNDIIWSILNKYCTE